ncbi:GNAT family N-acetyltransferase [Hyphomonas sp.]|uniref:GNAT family N-acetyltransferase n=1 Tax=Hyphomonas sp. TaxID=87 RepID=UPI00391B243D
MLPAPLRLLTIADADAAARLHASGFADAWNPASIAALIASETVLALGAEEAGALIAFALFQSAASDSELLTIATAPAHRGAGHASRLIAAALPVLAAAGNTRLLLDVAEDNAPARHLYARLGFTLDGRRKAYYTAGRSVPVDALLMSRPISG